MNRDELAGLCRDAKKKSSKGRCEPDSVVMSECWWLKGRENGMVDFTDDELARARTTGIIGMKIVAGCGAKLVRCVLDPKIPVQGA